MIATEENQVIALAGVFQAINNVKELAYRGQCESQAFNSSIRSILTQNASSVEEIFDNNSGIKVGLRVLRDQLSSDAGKRDPELARYAITLLHLESRLRGNQIIFERLGQGIQRLEAQVQLNGLTDGVIQNMADLYRDTISQLTPRIMVNGENIHLQNEHTASKIRASLLAGVRSAVLWRQCGGTRLKLLFKRATYLELGNAILERLPSLNPEDRLP